MSIFKTVKRNRVTADVSVTLKDTLPAQVNVDEVTHTLWMLCERLEHEYKFTVLILLKKTNF